MIEADGAILQTIPALEGYYVLEPETDDNNNVVGVIGIPVIAWNVISCNTKLGIEGGESMSIPVTTEPLSRCYAIQYPNGVIDIPLHAYNLNKESVVSALDELWKIHNR